MSKLNKNELLEGVRNIISEGFNNEADSFDGTSKFDIHRYVNLLIEEGHKNPDLMSYLLKYDNALSKGTKDFMIFEQFGQGLVKFAKGNKSVKNVINEMNSIIKSDGRNLVAYKLIENIQDPIIKEDISDAFNHYVYNRTEETKDSLIESIEPLLILSDPIAMQLNLMITEDSKVDAKLIDMNYYKDTEAKALQEKLQEHRNQKAMQKIYEKVQDYIDKKFDDEAQAELMEQEQYCLNAIANNQGLNLLEHINNIRKTDASTNTKLMEVLNMYADAINQGAYEERLYENFLYNISKFNYLIPVDKEMKAINEKATNKHEEITLTKILEEMKDTYASAIYVELIQEDVARYVKDPSPINRVQLRNALMPYASDPFINEMFEIIYSDNSRRANELSEKVLNIKDQINIIRENATVSNIFTPVQYICENESVFNVNGQFYVKKGNNIALLEDKYVDMLNENFVELCQLVNDPHVTIQNDRIILNGNELSAVIYEGYVDIHGHKESKESLRNLNEMCMKYDNYDTNFYIMCSCLLENFNNIAKVDWAKHVTLNENRAISADLFKLDQHIFMVTHNDQTSQHTFYRNVNPIFCKNKLNEHMGINVSSLFSDLLPSQDKIILRLNETKNSYEESIEKYEDMIEKLKDALDNASDENKKKLEDAVEDAEEKLEDVKKEYTEWQKQVDDATGTGDDEETDTDNDSEEDDDTVTEKPNEPMSDDEVEDAEDELTQPLDNEEGETAEPTDNFADEENDESSISDDEFADFLGNDSEDDEMGDDSEDAEETEMTDDSEEIDDEDAEDDETLKTFDSDDDFDFDDAIGDEEDDVDEIGDEDDDEESDEEAFPEVSLFGDEEGAEGDEEDDIFEPSTDTTEEPVETEEPEETEEPSEEFTNGEETPEIDDEDDTDDEGEAATDIFGGDTEKPLADDEEDVVTIPENTPETEEDKDVYQPKYSYKIADVMFDENVKENKKEKSGSVIVIIPMVDGTGKKYVENKTIQFYLDDDNNPILDNDPMTNELYAAVIDAIKNSPDYSTVCETGESANEEVGPTIAALNTPDDEEDEDWEAQYLRDGNDEDRGEYGLASDDEEDDDLSFFENAEDENPDEEDSEDDETPADTDDKSDDNFFGFNMNDFDDDEDEDEEDDEESKDDVIIPTYKSGDTEIEFPAPSVDGTEIPESVKPLKTKKAIKENKSIKIIPVFKNNKGKSFFLNEATIKASKKQDEKVTPLTEEIIDGSDANEISSSDLTGNQPIENYQADIELLTKLHDKALVSQELANEDGNNINVTDIEELNNVTFFIIDNEETLDSFHIYQIEDMIYFRDSQEFNDIINDSDNIELLTVESDTEDELPSYSINDVSDCMFLISSIFSALTGNAYDNNDINENCKIKRSTKLDSDNDIDNSKTADDAKNGTKSENDFKQECEDKQKKDGTVGALDPQQEENASYKPLIPNVNLIAEQENQFLMENADIEYEVNDKVIYKGEIWDVFAITGVVGDKQLLKITKAGAILDVTNKDIKPDPEALKDIDPSLAKQFDFDKNNLTKTPKNDKAEKMADLNGKTVECNIVVDSANGLILTGTLNGDRFKASLKDILEGLDDIRVYTDGYAEPLTWNKNDIIINQEDWVPAVIVTEIDEEPSRKIKVNPQSYVEAREDTDLVDCTIADKVTQFPKHSIRILV